MFRIAIITILLIIIIIIIIIMKKRTNNKDYDYDDLENNYISSLIKITKMEMKNNNKSSLSYIERQILNKYINEELRKINKININKLNVNETCEYKIELLNIRNFLLNIK